jgi:hypothetical protein
VEVIVEVFVGVIVDVGVLEQVFVGVDVLVGVGVLLDVKDTDGVLDAVILGVGVMVFDAVILGVGVFVAVNVGVGVSVGHMSRIPIMIAVSEPETLDTIRISSIYPTALKEILVVADDNPNVSSISEKFQGIDSAASLYKISPIVKLLVFK